MIDDIYELIKEEFEGIDAIYEESIIHMIGVFGLDLLKEHRLLESCGVVNGRQLYVLCPKQ